MIRLNSRGSSNSSYDQQVLGDERLVAAAQIGQAAAFDELCVRHAEKIFHVAHRITRNREDAEDVVQESFLRAFIHLKSFDGRSRFSTWLTRIAINSALMSLRKNRRSCEIPMEKSIESSEPRRRQFADPALNPERRLAEHERETILRDAITKLRPRIREAVEIHQLQERSLEDTAKALGISLAAAKGRLFQARIVLRRRLKSAVPSIWTSPSQIRAQPDWRAFRKGDAFVKSLSIHDWYRILRVHLLQGLRSSTDVSNDVAEAINTLGKELASGETNPNAAEFYVEVEGTARDLRPILRDEVYRIAGEALRNAFKHARAKKIEVEIHYDGRQLRLRVRDDGKGIDPKVLGKDRQPGDHGLLGMRERAKLIGGKLTLWSELDSGTELELSIPASQAYETSVQRRSWLVEKLVRKDPEKKS